MLGSGDKQECSLGPPGNLLQKIQGVWTLSDRKTRKCISRNDFGRETQTEMFPQEKVLTQGPFNILTQWKIRDRHNEIIWFAGSSNIFLRSKIQVDGDILVKELAGCQKWPNRAKCTTVMTNACECI